MPDFAWNGQIYTKIGAGAFHLVLGKTKRVTWCVNLICDEIFWEYYSSKHRHKKVL